MGTRKRIDMTSTEGLWTATFVFGMGVLVGWALYGRPGGIKTLINSGNIAEWVAAIGTWIIGFGAWQYAKQAHRFHVADVVQARRDERNKKRAVLADTILRVAYGRVPHKTLNSMIERHGDDLKVFALKTHLANSIMLANKIVVTAEDRAYFTSEVIGDAHKFDIELAWYKSYAEECLRSLDKEDDETVIRDSIYEPKLSYLKDQSEDLHKASDTLVDKVHAIRRQIPED